MSHGLSDATLGKIRRVFSGYPDLEKVLLYGSRAKGNQSAGSDIDLALVGRRLEERTLHRIDLELDELMLPYRFDLSLFAALDHPELIDHIERVGKVLYEKAESAGK